MSSIDQAPSPPSGTTPSSISSTTSSSSATSGKRGETSPPASTSASKKSKLDDKLTTIEIEPFLECTICLDFPSSPIHSCEKGHVLCGRCAPKFTACPTCQDPKLSGCPLGEKLAREANKKIQCVNSEAGCKEGVLSTKFKDHLPRCYFREISCYEVNCGVKVQFHEYTKHLEDVHKKKILIGPTFRQTYRHGEKDFTQSGTTFNWIQWPQTVIKFRDHQFIIHARVSPVSRQSQLFFSWVSVMGDKDTGDSFISKVKFHNKTSNKLGSAWRLQVLAFHDMPPNPSEAKLFEYSEKCGALSVPMDAIRKWGTMDADQILRFGVTYEIKDV